MLTKRGWSALGAGAFLWVTSRFIGSPDLHMVSVGIIVLPILGILFVRWRRITVEVHRSLSQTRVYPGTRVTVTLLVENKGRVTLSYLLLLDTVPAALGKPARVVVAGVPPRNAQTVSYSILCRHRGTYVVGPLTVFFADPFGLARVPVETSGTNDLIVYPEVEDIEPWKLGMQGAGSGESASRHLHRSLAEFYTMREYVTGDDLRRIHWPSVARTGQLMIRQDEATRRSAATLFLDNRSSGLGAVGSPGFERAVSVAATLGQMLMRSGFAIRVGLVDSAPVLIDEERFLQLLAHVGPVRTKTIGATLTRLRATSRPDTALAVVMAVPAPAEVAAMLRAGTVFGRKLAVMVSPVSPSHLPPAQAADVERRASAARVSLVRGGWQVFLVHPEGRLSDVWQPTRRPRRLQATG